VHRSLFLVVLCSRRLSLYRERNLRSTLELKEKAHQIRSRRVLLQQVEISSDSVWLDSESDGAEISTGAAQLLAERVSWAEDQATTTAGSEAGGAAGGGGVQPRC
jgi:hypothetical protein